MACGGGEDRPVRDNEGITTAGEGSIFVPGPQHEGDHQRYNREGHEKGCTMLNEGANEIREKGLHFVHRLLLFHLFTSLTYWVVGEKF